MADNTFFTTEIYQTEIALDTNQYVLQRIYKDNISANDKLPIEFFYVTDKAEKAERLKNHLERKFPCYSQFKVQPYKKIYEILGTTDPIQMDLQVINKWNQVMWDIGYIFDCKLDGWQVGL